MSTPAPPDPTNPDLLLGLRTYLFSEAVARDPRDNTDLTLPPMWIAPKLGTPAPGETDGLHADEVGQDVVTSIAKVTGIPPQRYENFLRTDGVRFVVRARVAAFAYEFEQKVRALINDRRNWLMFNVQVNESLLFRDLQPISSDNLGYIFIFEYLFSLWAPEF